MMVVKESEEWKQIANVEMAADQKRDTDFPVEKSRYDEFHGTSDFKKL